MTATLTEWDCAAVEETVTLLVSELVTNAVLHARSRLTICIDRDGDELRVGVSDGSSVIPRPRRYSSDAATGRGLGLVELMSSSWGATATESGKEIWFVVSTTAAGEERSWAEFDLDSVDAL